MRISASVDVAVIIPLWQCDGALRPGRAAHGAPLGWPMSFDRSHHLIDRSVGYRKASACHSAFAEASRLIVGDRLAYLRLGIHHERAVLRNRLVQRAPGEQ